MNRLQMSQDSSTMVNIHLDQTNSVHVQEVRSQILLSVQATIRKLLEVCRLPENFATMGLDFHYLPSSSSNHEQQPELGLTMLPGLMVVLHHLLALALTADQLVTELEFGLLHRQLASKVSMSLSILSQFVFHLTLVIPQVCLLEKVSFFKKNL